MKNTRPSRADRELLARGIMTHVSFHSRYLPTPQGYSFRVGDSRYVDLQDHTIRGRRLLIAWAPRPIFGGRVVTMSLQRPRRMPLEGPWFDGWSDRDTKSAARKILLAVERALAGRPDKPETAVPIVDPLSIPSEMPGAGFGPRRIDGDPA